MIFSIRAALEATDLNEGLALWSGPPNPVLVVVRSRLRAVRFFLLQGSNLREGLAFWRLSSRWFRLHAENGLRNGLRRDLAEKVLERLFLEYKTVRNFSGVIFRFSFSVVSLAAFGPLWLPLGLSGCLWGSLAAFRGSLAASLGLSVAGLGLSGFGWLWLPLAVSGALWLLLAGSGALWLPLGLSGCLWLLLGLSG